MIKKKNKVKDYSEQFYYWDDSPVFKHDLKTRKINTSLVLLLISVCVLVAVLVSTFLFLK